MVSALRLLDQAIALSDAVLDKAGSVRYVRIKGGGEGGLDRVRLRNGMPAPPGVAVQRGKKGGLFFDIAPDVDLNDLERQAALAAGGMPVGGAPPDLAPAPAMAGQPKRVANVAPAVPLDTPGHRWTKTPGGGARLKTRTKAPVETPDTATGGPMARNQKLGMLRGQRQAAQDDIRNIGVGLANVQRQMKRVIDELAAGNAAPHAVTALKQGADRLGNDNQKLVEAKARFADRNMAVQDEKRRQAGADQRRGERAARHGAARAANDPRLKRIPRVATLTSKEIVGVKTFREAGLHGGIHAHETFVAELKPGALPRMRGISDTRAVFKTAADEVNAEVASGAISDALGWYITPPIYRAKVGRQEGHLMRWADDSGFGGAAMLANSYRGNFEDPALRDSYLRMWVFDMMIGNSDRHGANWIVDPKEKRVWAIDNGYAMDKWNKNGNNYDRNHIRTHVLSRIPKLTEDDRKRLNMLRQDAIDNGPLLEAIVARECPGGLNAFQSRMKALAQQEF